MSEILYKYLPIDRLSYLKNELLRFTPPGDLNDPFECIPVLPLKEEIIKLLRKQGKETLARFDHIEFPEEMKNQINNNFLNQLEIEITAINKEKTNNFSELYFNQVVTQENNKLGIFSLSRRWNSTLMWSHYTNSHKGFCVGFNRNSSFFTSKTKINDSILSIQPVDYSADRIKVPIEPGKKIDTKFLLTKSIDWKYEKEERLIAYLEDCTKKIESDPFDIHLFKVPHNMISEIITGANILPEEFDKIFQFCLKKNIKLFRSEISKTKFDMTREPVT